MIKLVQSSKNETPNFRDLGIVVATFRVVSHYIEYKACASLNDGNSNIILLQRI